MPFGEDFEYAPLREQLMRFIVRNPNLSPEDSLKIWKLVENVGASPMTAWYEIAGVHGGGSPIMETIALGIEYDYETRKRLARYLAGIDQEFNDAKDLEREPTFGDGLVNERPGLKK